jgi:hypothetical protein
MIKKLKIFALALGMLVATSCELDLLDNPNAVSPESADNNFILNNIQLASRNLFVNASGIGMALTRMINQAANTYQAAYTATAGNGMWNTAYANILVDCDLLIARADASNLATHAGMARVFKANALMILVDHFNDVPYSQALNSADFNPGKDTGAAVYDEALALLNTAIDNFGVEPLANPANDLYFSHITAAADKREAWRRVAKTLKLKLLLNKGDAAGVNALIAENSGAGDFINTAARSWRFAYSTTRANPDSRHPRFIANYVNGGSQYQSNYYMWHITEAKKGTTGYEAFLPGDAGPNPDPRGVYYFNRQVSINPEDVNEIRCITENTPTHYAAKGFNKEIGLFCLPGQRGYWGRDHLDNQGIPPDNLKRTVPGVYPAGGRWDRTPSVGTNNQNLGNQGAGIEPMMMRSFQRFMVAEAQLRFNADVAAARAALTTAITWSIDDVRAFAVDGLEGPAITADTGIPNAAHNAARATYLANVQAEYDAATTNEQRMNIIGREYWLALFGNGVEAHNLYRRTGTPTNMQPGLNSDFGTYPRTLLYPLDHLARNRNATQRASMNDRVFWDNGPEVD